jgi:hypothetical protein
VLSWHSITDVSNFTCINITNNPIVTQGRIYGKEKGKHAVETGRVLDRFGDTIVMLMVDCDAGFG